MKKTFCRIKPKEPNKQGKKFVQAYKGLDDTNNTLLTVDPLQNWKEKYTYFMQIKL